MITLGNYFFRTRNWLFPVVLLAVLLVFPPRRIGDGPGIWLAAGGLALIFAGQSLRVITIGLDYIKRGGKDGRIWANSLVTGGVYAHCRNPMYVGNVAISLGYFLVSGNLIALAVGGAFFVVAYLAITLSEEAFLRGKFGAEYDAFCKRSPRFVPHLGAIIRTLRGYQFDWPAVIVKEYGTLFTTTALTMGILAWKAQRGGVLANDWPYFAAVVAVAGAFWGVARWLKKGRGLKSRGTTLTDGSLDQHRQRIDAIDADLLRLYNKRAEVVSAIFAIKRGTGLPRYDEARTERIMNRLKSLNEGPLTDEQVVRIFEPLLKYFAFEYDRGAIDRSPTERSYDRDMQNAPEVTVVKGA